MRFCANVSILFNDVPFLERFSRARRVGFSAVEFWWPADEDLGEVERVVKDADLAVVLLNFDSGDMSAGDRGLLSDPGRESRFRENVPIALELAERLGCTRLNALVGLRLPSLAIKDQLALAQRNVEWAADQAAGQGATITIEALNTMENGPYLIHSTPQAAQFVRSVARENVKLQYDAYHMQRMEGNLVDTLRAHIDDVAHVQIADSPGRGEPGTGEIAYPYVLRQLEAMGYRGHVGLEYRPSQGDTEESLRWLPEFSRSGEADLGDLNTWAT